MNIIIFNHHLSTWAGSEIVVVELIEELRNMGHNVRLICPFASPKFVHEALGDWNILLKDLNQYDQTAVDLVLVFHQGLSSLSEDEFSKLFAQQSRPFIAYFHLSPYEPFEFPGPFVEKALADAVFANSEETRNELGLHGFDNVELFQNPAPLTFQSSSSKSGQLKTLLSVSNHIPAELSGAFDILKADGIDVRRIGRPDGNRRITPDDLFECDAVVTIGKTVQYGLRSQRPVFCYDRFQGPGWLTPWNENEEKLNFSGRSVQTKLSAQQIADDIRTGFENASQRVRERGSVDFGRFHLEHFVDRLLDMVDTAKRDPDRGWPEWTKSSQWRQQFRTERSLYELVDRGYSKRQGSLPRRGNAAKAVAAKSADRLTRQVLRMPRNGEPMVVAVFSYRYDAHLIDDLIKNISPAIHGYVALDDRDSSSVLSNEAERQLELYRAAEGMGANWIFVADPDERYENALADKMAYLTAAEGPVVWTMECREMFTATQYRYDGIWSNRPRLRLFPCWAGMEPDTNRLHGQWTSNGLKLPIKASGIAFYHLRMATAKRRDLRRRLYAQSDPNREFQSLGYDYIDDERGMRLRTVPALRKFTPEHVEDGGVWAPELVDTEASGVPTDPLKQRLQRITQSRLMQGYENAMHAAQDLAEDYKGDYELELLLADTALKAGFPDVAIAACNRVIGQQSEPLFALRLRTEAFLTLGQKEEAKRSLQEIDDLGLQFDTAFDLKLRLLKAGPTGALDRPKSLWRRWLTDGRNATAQVHMCDNVSDAKITVVVICMSANPNVLDAVNALRAQSVECEIVVVNSNGGSARSVLQDHLDSITVIDIEQRLYAGAARNVGIDASITDYICFLASDCLPTEGWVEGRLKAHLDGYHAVPSSVIPQDDASDAALACWIWLYSGRINPQNIQQDTAYSLSYNRRVFDKFGYFPTGVRIGEDSILNNRLRTKIEIAPDAGLSLVHAFENDLQAVEGEIQTRAKLRMQFSNHRKTNSLDFLRIQTKSQIAKRLASAKVITSAPKAMGLRNPDYIADMMEDFAKLEGQQVLCTGEEILRAKSLQDQAAKVALDRPDLAYSYTNKAIVLWPHCAELYLDAAKYLHATKDSDSLSKTLSLAMRAYAADPELTEAISFVVKVLVDEKKFQRAYDVLRWAVALNPRSVAVLLIARLLPGPRFRAIRAMYFQMAFIVSPISPPANRLLITYYKNTDDQSSFARRKRMLDSF